MNRLQGKRVMITGASAGIGAACARHFAARGAHLHLTARRLDRLEALARELSDAHGVEAEAGVLDVTDRDAVFDHAAGLAGSGRVPDILVNNAGKGRGLDKLHEGSTEHWDEMIDTNVKGLLYVSRAVIPHLVKKGGGDVVNIGSVAGRWVYPKGAAYCGSKHAERAINEGMRIDLNGTGVRVTTVDPGLVETEFSIVRFHGDEKKADATYQGMTPLTGRDVAETIRWIVERPRHVNVAELVLYPTDQAAPTIVHRRG